MTGLPDKGRSFDTTAVKRNPTNEAAPVTMKNHPQKALDLDESIEEETIPPFGENEDSPMAEEEKGQNEEAVGQNAAFK